MYLKAPSAVLCGSVSGPAPAPRWVVPVACRFDAADKLLAVARAIGVAEYGVTAGGIDVLGLLVISNWSPALLKLICSILMPAGIDGCQLAAGFDRCRCSSGAARQARLTPLEDGSTACTFERCTRCR